jgi:hypothetical protein
MRLAQVFIVRLNDSFGSRSSFPKLKLTEPLLTNNLRVRLIELVEANDLGELLRESYGRH